MAFEDWGDFRAPGVELCLVKWTPDSQPHRRFPYCSHDQEQKRAKRLTKEGIRDVLTRERVRGPALTQEVKSNRSMTLSANTAIQAQLPSHHLLNVPTSLVVPILPRLSTHHLFGSSIVPTSASLPTVSES